MSRVATLLAAAVTLGGASSAWACAGCSNPNLPAGRSQGLLLRAGEVSTSINLSATTMRVVHSEYCPDIGPICLARDEPGQLHDQTFYVGELRPIIELGLTDTLGLEAQLPFRWTRTTIVFRRLTGEAFVPDYENIHHRNETLLGIADPWLSLRGGWNLAGWRLVAKAGLSLPLGRTEPDPFAAGRAGERHQHIQYGTGTFNPVLSVDVGRVFGRWTLGAYGQTMLAFYDNDKGYRAGHRFLGGLLAQTRWSESNLRLGLSADVLNEQPERWGGVIQQDGNVGRTDVLVGGLAGYPFGETMLLVTVKVPVWQKFIEVGDHTHREPGQLTYPAVVNVALQRAFSVW